MLHGPWLDPSLAAQVSVGGLGMILPYILILIILYVLMILPAQRRQKKLAAMIAALKNGDKVITNGGLYGTVVGLDPESVQLRIAEQVKIRVARNGIAGLQPEANKES
jgi:preprotein translocase subunit YajC